MLFRLAKSFDELKRYLLQLRLNFQLDICEYICFNVVRNHELKF